jgi:hypothetical protein
MDTASSSARNMTLCCHLPKCLLTDATVLFLARLYTRRLLSQYPPLNRNLASCDTTNKWLLSGRLGWKGPDSFLLVLQGNKTAYHLQCRSCRCFTSFTASLWRPYDIHTRSFGKNLWVCLILNASLI